MGLSVSFYENKFSNPEGLIKFIDKNKSIMKVKESKILISANWNDSKDKIIFVTKIVKKLAVIANKKTPSSEGVSY